VKLFSQTRRKETLTQTATIEQLSALFERELSMIEDTTYIDALRGRWAEPAIRAGLLPLAGIVNVTELPRKYPIHPLEYWEVERVNLREPGRFAVPQEAREKLSRASKADMPVKWLLWAEQHVTPPEIEYRQETIYTVKKVYRKFDPALIALLKCGEEIGIPYLVHCWLHG
jgi:hypothetical protein